MVCSMCRMVRTKRAARSEQEILDAGAVNYIQETNITVGFKRPQVILVQ